MQAASSEFVGAEEVFLHVWGVPTTGDGTRRGSEHEVELIGSHTGDPSHLDPSCSACHHLRARMESIARTASERMAHLTSEDTYFDVYTAPASIVCGNGQRPCVTVSIYVRDQANQAHSNSHDDPVSQLKQVLAAFGIRER